MITDEQKTEYLQFKKIRRIGYEAIIYEDSSTKISRSYVEDGPDGRPLITIEKLLTKNGQPSWEIIDSK